MQTIKAIIDQPCSSENAYAEDDKKLFFSKGYNPIINKIGLAIKNHDYYELAKIKTQLDFKAPEEESHISINFKAT